MRMVVVRVLCKKEKMEVRVACIRKETVRERERERERERRFVIYEREWKGECTDV